MKLSKVTLSPVFSAPLYQAAKPKPVIPGYTAQRKSVSATPQSWLCQFYV